MDSYDLILSHDGKMDMRPAGATPMLQGLYDAVKGDSKGKIDPQHAADAHNYICALEARCAGLYHELQTMRTQRHIITQREIERFRSTKVLPSNPAKLQRLKRK